QIAPTGPSYKLTQSGDLLNWPTGISSTETQSGFDVFPNPSSGSINISFAAASATLRSINIVNVMGQIVKQIPVANQSLYNINLSDITKGVYIVQCQFEEGIVTKKIVLQ